MAMDDIRNLVAERANTHGDAWKVTGIILTELERGNKLDDMLKMPTAFAWIMCLNKLVRALINPRVLDHWRDLAGYATLALDHLEEPIQPSE